MTETPLPDAVTLPSREYRDPKELIPHEKLDALWLEESDSADIKRQAADEAANGLIEPLKITVGGKIVDGRRRWLAAMRAQLPMVPCEIVADADVELTAVRSMLHRRHLTPGQMAYVLSGTNLLDAAFEEAKNRMLWAAGHTPRNSVSRGQKGFDKGVEEWAKEIGVSVQYLRAARELHDKYWSDETRRTMTDKWGVVEKGVTFRSFFEPRLMAPENAYGIGAVKAGCQALWDQEEREKAGKTHKGGRPKDADKQLELFKDIASTFGTRLGYWTKFAPAEREEALRAWDSVVEQMPDDLLWKLRKKMALEELRRRKSNGVAGVKGA